MCGRDGGVGSGSGAEGAKAAWADDASLWWFFLGARTTHNLTHFEGWTTMMSNRVETEKKGSRQTRAARSKTEGR